MLCDQWCIEILETLPTQSDAIPFVRGTPTPSPGRQVTMNPLLLILILFLLFGGGGFYIGGPAIGGSALGLVLLICLIVYLMGGFRGK